MMDDLLPSLPANATDPGFSFADLSLPTGVLISMTVGLVLSFLVYLAREQSLKWKRVELRLAIIQEQLSAIALVQSRDPVSAQALLDLLMTADVITQPKRAFNEEIKHWPSDILRRTPADPTVDNDVKERLQTLYGRPEVQDQTPQDGPPPAYSSAMFLESSVFLPA